MKFWLGTHQPSWLRFVDVPLFISHTRLKRYRVIPRAISDWALDSGGFTEVTKHGGWKTTVPEYLEAVERYAKGAGRLVWAAPMDWMCEPDAIRATGLSVREHQERTVTNYLELKGRGPFIPVLQGWELEDYVRCVALYAEAGVDLRAEPLVGIGSVCRRQATSEIAELIGELSRAGLRLHGFGVKTSGFARYGHLLHSADSMAWSYDARRSDALPECRGKHASCQNCPVWARRWRLRALAVLAGGPATPPVISPRTATAS